MLTHTEGRMMRREKSKFHAVTRVSPMPYNSFWDSERYLICGNNITLTEIKAVYGISWNGMVNSYVCTSSCCV